MLRSDLHRKIVAALALLTLLSSCAGQNRQVSTAPVATGTIVVQNTKWDDWINCSGSTNGDVTISMSGYFQGYAANGGSFTMKARPGSHTITITRKPGDYCWQDERMCTVNVVAGQTSTIVITGVGQLTCPQ